MEDGIEKIEVEEKKKRNNVLIRLGDHHRLMAIDKATGMTVKELVKKYNLGLQTVNKICRSPIFRELVNSLLDDVRRDVKNELVAYATKAAHTLYELCHDTHKISVTDPSGIDREEIQVTKPGDRINAAGKILQGSQILEPDSGQKIVHLNMFAPKWKEDRNEDGTIDVTLNQDA